MNVILFFRIIAGWIICSCIYHFLGSKNIDPDSTTNIVVAILFLFSLAFIISTIY